MLAVPALPLCPPVCRTQLLEDFPRQVEARVAATAAGGAAAPHLSSLVVPPLLRLMQSGSEEVRRSAVACLNLMAPHMPTGLHDNVDGWVRWGNGERQSG